MTEEKIYEIALSKYPIDEFWIGAGDSSRLYDQNARDRAVFIKGFKEALRIHDVVGQSEQSCKHPEDEQTWMRSGKASYCNKCGEMVKAN